MRIWILLILVAGSAHLETPYGHPLAAQNHSGPADVFSLTYSAASDLQIHKRALSASTLGTYAKDLRAKAVAAVRLSSNVVRNKAERSWGRMIPALHYYLETVARAEVPRQLKSWRMFQDGSEFREGIRRSNIAFVRFLDKIRQPSHEYRYMRKKWRYEPDLRRHYLFPRILRVPVITQQSELPYDKEVENFTKGNDDEFGHRSLVLAHLPLYANRFADKPDIAAVPLGHEVEAELLSTDEKGTDTNSIHEIHQHAHTQDAVPSTSDANEDTPRSLVQEQQPPLQVVDGVQSMSLKAIRPKHAEPDTGLFDENLTDDASDLSPHGYWRDNMGTWPSDTTEEAFGKSTTSAATTPRHMPHGSGIFFAADGVQHQDNPLEGIVEGDSSTELKPPSQASPEKHLGKGADAIEVALNFHNTLMDMRHRYNNFLKYQRSQVHKASLRYPGHPEYEPELDPANDKLLEKGTDRPVTPGTIVSDTEGYGLLSATPSRSQPISPLGRPSGFDAWAQHDTDTSRLSSGPNSPLWQSQKHAIGHKAWRYPAQYPDFLYAFYREVDAPYPLSPSHPTGQDDIPFSESALRTSNEETMDEAKTRHTRPLTPPSSPQHSSGEASSPPKHDLTLHGTETFDPPRKANADIGDLAEERQTGLRGFRRFSSHLKPVDVQLPADQSQHPMALLSHRHSGESTPTPRLPNADDGMSRTSSVSSFAFRPSGLLTEHPTPRMPSNERTLKPGAGLTSPREEGVGSTSATGSDDIAQVGQHGTSGTTGASRPTFNRL